MKNGGPAIAGWLLISPALDHLCIFAIWLVAYAVFISLNRWPQLGAAYLCTGLENSRLLASEGASAWQGFWHSSAPLLSTDVALFLVIFAIILQQVRSIRKEDAQLAS